MGDCIFTNLNTTIVGVGNVGITMGYYWAFVWYSVIFLSIGLSIILLRKKIWFWFITGTLSIIGVKGLYFIIDLASHEATEGNWDILKWLCYGMLAVVVGFILDFMFKLRKKIIGD